MKIFISQAMAGRNEDAIREEREQIMAQAEARYGKKQVMFLNSFFDKKPKDDAERIEMLADSIKVLAQADIAIFAPKWLNNNGCYIEYEVCRRYGIAKLLL